MVGIPSSFRTVMLLCRVDGVALLNVCYDFFVHVRCDFLLHCIIMAALCTVPCSAFMSSHCTTTSCSCTTSVIALLCIIQLRHWKHDVASCIVTGILRLCWQQALRILALCCFSGCVGRESATNDDDSEADDDEVHSGTWGLGRWALPYVAA